MSASSQEKKYIDLHVTGMGYLSRIRTVTPKKGEPFLACTIAALVGEIGEGIKPEYRYFDVKVTGAQAKQLVSGCEEAISAGSKVLIGFRLGDFWTEVFTYNKGKNEGKTGVSLKGRLLSVGWIQVDGKQIYKAEKAEKQNADAEQSVVTPPDEPVSNAA